MIITPFGLARPEKKAWCARSPWPKAGLSRHPGVGDGRSVKNAVAALVDVDVFLPPFPPPRCSRPFPSPRVTRTRMAVVTLRRLLAASAWLPAVSAGLQREQPYPWAPVQTPAPRPEAENLVAAAAVTALPVMRGMPWKRQSGPANTCGFVDGDAGQCRSAVSRCM